MVRLAAVEIVILPVGVPHSPLVRAATVRRSQPINNRVGTTVVILTTVDFTAQFTLTPPPVPGAPAQCCLPNYLKLVGE